LGYEEAAAQGFVAGVNAVLAGRGESPFVPGRDEAYIGVMLDDLTTKEIDEPYRMFTSRAEFRLRLRQDNADERLMSYGCGLGLVEESVLERVRERVGQIERTVEQLGRTPLRTTMANERLRSLGLEEVRKSVTLEELLRRPDMTMSHLRVAAGFDPGHDPALDPFVECEVKYRGYIERQDRAVRSVRQLDARPIPADFSYDSVPGLSAEARQKLAEKRPETVGQASRIAGVRAADLSIVIVKLDSHQRGTPSIGNATY
jgi:tRNA uridine 5-carboxymethylaminomethyl modification enzyme